MSGGTDFVETGQDAMGKEKKFGNFSESKKKHMVLVLGMHRSGTSALGGVLHQLGCSLPENVIGSSENNKKGYFESRAAQILDDRILVNAGSNWRDWRRIPENWMNSEQAKTFVAEAAALIEKEYQGASLILLKEPRICRLAPLWLRAADSAGYDVLPVLTHRNPMEVAKSLKKRNGISYQEGLLIWLRHVLDAEAYTRGMKRSFLNFSSFIENWAASCERISSDLWFNFPKFGNEVYLNIEEFIEKDLQNFKESPEKIIGNSGFPSWVREVFEIMERWVSDGEMKSDYARLDGLRSELDAAEALFGGLVGPPGEGIADLLAKVDQTGDRAAELMAIQEDSEAVRRRAGELDARVKERETRIAELDERCARLEKARGGLEDELAQTRSALAQRRLEADQTLERAEAAEQALDEARLEIEDWRGRLQDAEASRASLVKRVEDLEGYVETSRRELGKMAQIICEQGAARERLVTEGQAHRTEIGARVAEVKELTEQLQKALLERDALKRETEGRVASLTDDLAAAGVQRAQLERDVLDRQRELGRMAKFLSEVEQERNARVKEVGALRSSTSWRLTHPLRVLIDRMRGNR